MDRSTLLFVIALAALTFAMGLAHAAPCWGVRLTIAAAWCRAPAPCSVRPAASAAATSRASAQVGSQLRVRDLS